MNVDAPGWAVNVTVVVDPKVLSPGGEIEHDLVARDVDDGLAGLRFDSGEVLSWHGVVPFRSGLCPSKSLRRAPWALDERGNALLGHGGPQDGGALLDGLLEQAGEAVIRVGDARVRDSDHRGAEQCFVVDGQRVPSAR